MRFGDILLVKNKIDPIAWVIRKVTKSNFNHTCIALGSNYILDIRAKKIEVVSKEKYLNEYLYDCKLLRIKGLQDFEIKVILKYIFNQKRRYSYITWLISGILILCGKKPLRPICSGLIAEAFQQVGYYFRLDKEPYQITPEDINQRRRMKDVTKNLYTNTNL